MLLPLQHCCCHLETAVSACAQMILLILEDFNLQCIFNSFSRIFLQTGVPLTPVDRSVCFLFLWLRSMNLVICRWSYTSVLNYKMPLCFTSTCSNRFLRLMWQKGLLSLSSFVFLAESTAPYQCLCDCVRLPQPMNNESRCSHELPYLLIFLITGLRTCMC